MDTNFIIAQIFGVLSMASSVCSMQFKKRKAILIALFCLNTFAALNMVFLGSLSAAYIDRKSTRLNSSHPTTSRMPSSA